MSIYLKNNPSKLHLDPIWNDGALGFFWRDRPNKKKNNKKTSSDMISVTDQKYLMGVIYAEIQPLKQSHTTQLRR